jgi:hypothetical protein
MARARAGDVVVVTRMKFGSAATPQRGGHTGNAGSGHNCEHTRRGRRVGFKKEGSLKGSTPVR